VSEFAYSVALKLKNKFHDINPNRVRIAALLHDIGKQNDSTHQFDGKKILEIENLVEIGEIISKHMEGHESAEANGIEGDFTPKTMEEKIVAYADLNFYPDKKLTPKERIDSKIQKAIDKGEHVKVEVMNKARPRLLKLAEEMEGYLSATNSASIK
jgi:HD superfamily phosphodiesterase